MDNELRNTIWSKLLEDFEHNIKTDLANHPSQSDQRQITFAIVNAMDVTFNGCCDYIDQRLSSLQ